MLKTTSRLTQIMATEQQKKNIVIIGRQLKDPAQISHHLRDQVAVLSARQQHTTCRIMPASTKKETASRC
jgi:hypothetical protein